MLPGATAVDLLSAHVSNCHVVIVGCLFRPKTFGSREKTGAGAVRCLQIMFWVTAHPCLTRICSQHSQRSSAPALAPSCGVSVNQ